MERAVLVYTTYPSVVEAERAGRAILALPIEGGDPDYLRWIFAETEDANSE